MRRRNAILRSSAYPAAPVIRGQPTSGQGLFPHGSVSSPLTAVVPPGRRLPASCPGSLHTRLPAQQQGRFIRSVAGQRVQILGFERITSISHGSPHAGIVGTEVVLCTVATIDDAVK